MRRWIEGIPSNGERMSQPVLDPGLPPVPDLDAVAERYRAFDKTLAGGSTVAVVDTVRAWDGLRRELETWSSLTNLRFTQDTRDPSARAARERVDAAAAVLEGYDTSIKRRLTVSDARPQLAARVGAHAFELWENDLATYDPAIEADLVAEAGMRAEYMALMAGIEVDFAGERLNLSGLAKFQTNPDRSLRYGAAKAQWDAMGERADALDALFDRLVHLRDAMARKLGFAGFTQLGYARMRRVDYDRTAVERYREAIRTHVVPVAMALAQRAAKRLGLPALARWDERFLGTDAPPQPRGDAQWIVHQAIDGFADLDPRLGDFARLMNERELLDLVARPGKAGGGYCTSFPTLGVPFVFSNFNGSSGDITVLMHELGHAFQAYSSRDLPLVDYLWSTYEAAEVHSMSLEFLSWPVMERFFGNDADAYRENHLADSLMFLPYGVAVDHFQHLVYESPHATPQERHAMWQFVERRYLPWRTYGNLARPNAGAFWQAQSHIYRSPFYYIDYTLALCCAMQMWVQAEHDPADAFARYAALCARGGEAPFRTLVAGAGLAEPFDPDALPAIIAKARAVLAI
jgi:M3 family oligoendopeptidase